MYLSEHFGRAFWVDSNNEFRSCPLFVNNKPDYSQADYVSEWTDWDGVDMNLLLAIHRSELINKVQYAGSLTHKEAPVVDTFTTKNKSNMNTYNEQFYKEIVKDTEFSYGKFNENNYPLHLQQH